MSTIPDDLSPDALRKEADRRDLVRRHQDTMKRRAARNAIIDAILAIDCKDVRTAGVSQILRTACAAIAREEAADTGYAMGGDVNALSIPGIDNWWVHRNANEFDVEEHEVCRRYRLGNYTGPSW